MIDEQELYALGEPGHGPATACRPVEAVIARGTRLRRRRQALRTVGATAGVVGLISVGLLIRADAPTRDLDVQSIDTPASQSTTADPPPATDCEPDMRGGTVDPDPADGSEPASSADPSDEQGYYGPDPVSPEDMPDELRVLPGWAPTDRPITVAQGSRWPLSCASTPDHPFEDRLAWTIEIGGAQEGPQTGIVCYIEAVQEGIDPSDIFSQDGQHVTVNGQDALWKPSPIGPDGAMALTWLIAPDIIVVGGCLDWDTTRTLPLEDILPMAESMVPVPADDARIPDDPRLPE
jgi:hypothetical protein